MAEEPFVLLKTAQESSRNSRAFCNYLSYVIPNVAQTNHSKLNLDGLAERALKSNAEKTIITNRWNRDLEKIGFLRVDRKGLHAVPPSIYVKKAKAHKDLQDNMSKRRAEPFVVTTPQENFSKVERFGEALSEFIDISILPLEEVYDEKLILTYRFQHIHQTVQLSYLSFFPKFVEIDPRLGYSI